jgi:hypothetical protein
MTSFQGEWPVLYKNHRGQHFEDVTASAKAGSGLLPQVNWGVGFADFDNDGDRDLYVVNGHLQDLIEKYDDSAEYEARDAVLQNDGDGTFSECSAAGNALAVRASGRGASFDDLDNDGDIDGVVLNSRRKPTVFRNQATGNHWLCIRLCGRRANRDGVGSQVRVTAGGRTQIAEVHSGRGYQSHFGTRLHFGLGEFRQVERVEVRWPGGRIDVLTEIPADQLLTVLEGSD